MFRCLVCWTIKLLHVVALASFDASICNGSIMVSTMKWVGKKRAIYYLSKKFTDYDKVCGSRKDLLCSYMGLAMPAPLHAMI